MLWNLFERIINAVKPGRESQQVSDESQSWPESSNQQPEDSQEQSPSSQETVGAGEQNDRQE